MPLPPYSSGKIADLSGFTISKNADSSDLVVRGQSPLGGFVSELRRYPLVFRDESGRNEVEHSTAFLDWIDTSGSTPHLGAAALALSVKLVQEEWSATRMRMHIIDPRLVGATENLASLGIISTRGYQFYDGLTEHVPLPTTAILEQEDPRTAAHHAVLLLEQAQQQREKLYSEGLITHPSQDIIAYIDAAIEF